MTTPANEDKWAVIYCRKEGAALSSGKWKAIERSLDKHGVSYEVMRPTPDTNAEAVAAQAVRQGYRTLIMVGGDSDFNLMLNGIIASTPQGTELPVVGILPNGLFNDFARFWGMDESNHDSTIAAFAKGRVRPIDLGVCTFEQDGEKRVRYFHDCVNVGLAALVANITYRTRRFWGIRIPAFATSALLLLFQRMEYKMQFTINWETVEKRAMTLCVGSGLGYGQTPSAVPYNGLLDVTMVSLPKVRQLMEGLWLLFTGRFLSHRNVMAWRTKKITFGSLGKAKVSLDGRILGGGGIKHLSIGIREEHIRMLLP